MNNEVEIRVTSRDHTREGFASARHGAETLNDRLRALNGRFSAVKAAALGLGPAMLPALAAGAVAAAGMGVALASAGAAAGVFGLVTKTAFTEVQEASAKFDDLRQKIALLGREAQAAASHGDSVMSEKYLKAQARAVTEYRARLALLPPATRAVVTQYGRLKTTWEGFVERNKPAVYGVMSAGFGLVGRAVGQLQPLFDVGAKFASKWVGALAGFVDGGGLTRLVAFLTSRAGPALSSLTAIIGDLVAGFANMARAVPTKGGLLGFLESGAQKFRDWTAASGGFTGFLAYVKTVGPKVWETLAQVGTALANIARAVTPLAPLSLAVAGALAAILAALPPGAITAMVGGYIAMSVALRAIAVGTRIWAGAQLLLNLALAANPVGLVIAAVALLAAGLVLAWKRSETFRAVVTAVFRETAKVVITAVKFIMDAVLGLVIGILHVVGKIPGPWQDSMRKAEAAVRGFRDSADRHFDDASRAVGRLGQAVIRLPKMKTITMKVRDQVSAQVRSIQLRINSLTGKTVAVRVITTSGKIMGDPDVRIGGSGHAAGGIVGAASGGIRSRLTEVGEHGRELLDLPPGTRVRSNPDTERILSGGGGRDVRVVLEIRSAGSKLDDLLVEVLRNAVRVRGGGDVQSVLGR